MRTVSSTTELLVEPVSSAISRASAKEQCLPKVAFVTNFCPHYRVKSFEMLAERFDADFYFFSDGAEWYWPKQHGTHRGRFAHEYLPGFRLLGTRITPTLPLRLGRRKYEAIIKCIDGRFALAATYLTAQAYRCPFILWTGIWSDINTRFHRVTAPAIRHIYGRAAAIVGYGEHVRRYLIGLGVPQEKIFVAAHAVDNEVYARPVAPSEINALRKRLHLEAGDRVILYLGRLEESKGLRFLVNAFRRVAKEAVLVIAGDGAERGTLEKLAKEYEVSRRVRFAGYVAPDQTLPFYAMSYAFVLPSISTRAGKEPWGLVVNEALNQGVPVIATDAVGAAAGGLVQDGVNGFVIPESDPAALARALEMILGAAQLRAAMSENARRIISKWDNDRMIRGFEEAISYAMHKDDRLLTSR